MLGQRMPMTTRWAADHVAAAAGAQAQQHRRRPRAAARLALAPPRASSSDPAAAAPASAVSPASHPRRLILLRHAASEEAGRARSDHDRPVSARGREEARAVAERLAALGWRPDLVVGSNSRRTVQTLDVMAEAQAEAFGSADAHLLGSLYTVAATDGQTRQKLSEVIARVAGDGGGGGAAAATVVTTVMAVGHNRGWEEAASSFARASVRLQTATAALLEHVGAGAGAGADAGPSVGEEGGGSGSGKEGGSGAVTWAEALAGEWRLVQVVSPSSSSH